MNEKCHCPECKNIAFVSDTQSKNGRTWRTHECKPCDIRFVSIEWEYSHTIIQHRRFTNSPLVTCECGSKMLVNNKTLKKVYFRCPECKKTANFTNKEVALYVKK